MVYPRRSQLLVKFAILTCVGFCGLSLSSCQHHSEPEIPKSLPNPGPDGADAEVSDPVAKAKVEEEAEVRVSEEKPPKGFHLNSDQILKTSVDIRDLVAYPENAAKKWIARAIYLELKDHPTKYFPAGVTLTLAGPSRSQETRINKIHGVEVLSQTATEDGYGVELWAFFHKAETGFQVEKLHLQFDSEMKVVDGGVVGNPIKIADTHWQIHVSIYDQLIRLEEPSLGIVKFYPVGVGAIDSNGITPMQNGTADSLGIELPGSYLSPSLSMWSRTEPALYKGKPFLRVVNTQIYKGDGYTPFGFHEAITRILHRTFVSNGCYRMRDKDLYELAAIVKSTPEPGVPLELLKSADLGGDNPYPRARWYYIIKTATDENGEIQALRDDEGYYQMVRIQGKWQKPKD